MPELLTTGERWNEPRSLLLAAECQDRKRRRARVHRDGYPHSGVCPRQLLEHEDVRQEVRACAAVLLGDADAHETEFRELGEELVRKLCSRSQEAAFGTISASASSRVSV